MLGDNSYTLKTTIPSWCASKPIGTRWNQIPWRKHLKNWDENKISLGHRLVYNWILALGQPECRCLDGCGILTAVPSLIWSVPAWFS